MNDLELLIEVFGVSQSYTEFKTFIEAVAYNKPFFIQQIKTQYSAMNKEDFSEYWRGFVDAAYCVIIAPEKRAEKVYKDFFKNNAALLPAN